LTGLGIAAVIEQLSSAARQRRCAIFSLAGLAALGACSAGRDLLQPYRAKDDVVTREFARWLWTDYARDADLFCASGDLGIDFLPKRSTPGACAVYTCYRRIFSRMTGGRMNGDFDPMSAASHRDRRVRVVFVDEVPRDNPRCTKWLTTMSASHEARAPSVFVVHPGTPALDRERYVVLEFIPKDARQLAGRRLASDAAQDGRASVRQ
jgi:hypothetical protein